VRGGKGGERRGETGAWSDEELDAAEDGLKLFGTLMYAEEGEATETKAYKSAQAAHAQNAGKPGWQQEVFDSDGRRRLHGAFTGGFSAGYFNTVGSKEGWTPATFVSSRSNRAKITAQRTEDFMDAEDVAEQATGGKQLETTEEFAGLGSAKAAALPDSLLVPTELLVPATDPIGLRMLRLMGWRDGQGVGPRRKRARGIDRDPSDGESNGDDAEGGECGALHKDFKFAPKDVEQFEAQVKDDLSGLGFDPLAATPEFVGLLNSTSGALAKAQRKKLLSSRLAFGGSKNDGGDGGAFGLAIDDDPDAFDDGAVTHSKEDYDVEMGGEEEEENLMQLARQPQKKTARKPGAGGKLAGGGEGEEGEASVPWGGVGGRKVCSDGRKPLAGFVLASSAVLPKKLFPPPKVPDDFVPVHRFNQISNVPSSSADATSRAGARGPPAPAPRQIADLDTAGLLALAKGKPIPLCAPARHLDQGAGSGTRKHGGLTAKDRAELLGETPLPVCSRWEGGGAGGGGETYAQRAAAAAKASGMSSEHQAHVQLMLGSRFARGGVESSAAKGAGGAGGAGAGEGEAAGGGAESEFKPFVHDTAKQARYESFLGHRNSNQVMRECAALGMQTYECHREREEFEKSAAMFARPAGNPNALTSTLSGPVGTTLSSRFAPSDKLEDSAESAARAGMFGKLTRARYEWRPDKLACKRFNVPDPFFGRAAAAKTSKGSAVAMANAKSAIFASSTAAATG